jgi:hypothetical protein
MPTPVLPGYFGPLRHAWTKKQFRLKVLLTAICLVPILFLLTRFLANVERRPGVVLDDPILLLFNPVNVTWVIFLVIYAGIIGGVIYLLRHPYHLLIAVQTYGLMAIVRMASMAVVPLDPPLTMIALKDPFVELFGSGTTLTRDLFFSGHTSTLFMLSLAMPTDRSKVIYLLATCIVAGCVILQHVHYTIDVLMALFVAFGCYNMLAALHHPIKGGPVTGYNNL